jgi:hypothetical protein
MLDRRKKVTLNVIPKKFYLKCKLNKQIIKVVKFCLMYGEWTGHEYYLSTGDKNKMRTL